MIGLKTNILDFEIIPTGNVKTLVFADSSSYSKQPDSPILQLKLPGFTKHFTINIDFGKVNVLNSHLIGLTNVLKNDECSALPDGIYEITYKICPYDFFTITKYYLKSDLLELDIASIFNSVNCNTNITELPNLKKQITDILILLQSAKSCVNEGYIERGQKDFILAQKKVNKLIQKI